MKLSNEAKIGIMVTAVVIALGYLTIRTGDFNFRKEGYVVKVQFYNIDGVDLNAPVRLNGMEVGVVKGMRVVYGDDAKMELTLMIDEDTKIFNGAQAYVKNMGLFGEKYVALTLGQSRKGQIKPGSTIVGEDPPNFEQLMADGSVIADNLKVITEEVKERLNMNSQNIDVIMANLRKTSENVVDISDNVRERLDVNDAKIDSIVTNMDSASKNLDEMTYDLKLNPWKLMYKKTEQVRKGIKKEKPTRGSD